MDVEENCHLTSADSEQYHTELTVSAWIHLMFCFLLVWKFNATRVGIWTDKIDVYVTTPCIYHTCYTDVPLVSLHEKCLSAGASTENEPSSTTTLSHGQLSYAAEGSILLYLW